ncbi:hypothetical protein Nepgr_033930 [Nepenthes gracilis]|uniref:Uncharacterized protein n=1 Tax=Nepenthes gracilis TaxID=150966 RepID=A0AAD3Y969_NEPGR|nr:hypothetical protein Nepgr_033930 [Nepenthes gracilis]
MSPLIKPKYIHSKELLPRHSRSAKSTPTQKREEMGPTFNLSRATLHCNKRHFYCLFLSTNKDTRCPKSVRADPVLLRTFFSPAAIRFRISGFSPVAYSLRCSMFTSEDGHSRSLSTLQVLELRNMTTLEIYSGILISMKPQLTPEVVIPEFSSHSGFTA